ncbi:MAG: ABC transporter permease subunit [Spirochaetales bacterium]
MQHDRLNKNSIIQYLIDFLYSFLLPVIVILTLWTTESHIIGSPLILPTPQAVFARLFASALTTDFWMNLAVTTLRTVYAFFISLVLSVFLGTLAGFFRPFERFLSLPLGIIKATPVVSFILLAIFWFSTNTVSIFIGVLMTLPVMTGQIMSGIKNVDKKLIDMAHMYHFTGLQKVLHVYKPSVMPFFLAGCLNAFSLSWKVVVAAEVLSLPRTGVGTVLQRSKMHIETVDVFAYTVAIILMSFILEQVLAVLLGAKKSSNMGHA